MDGQTVSLPLTAIRLDPQQPRLCLPADLRARFVARELEIEDVIAELVGRAGRGDVEAMGYVENIRQLADSIRLDGQLQPIGISAERDKDGAPVYRLIWGERRFWALAWLRAKAASQRDGRAQDWQIVAVVRGSTASGEDIRRWQWSENQQREDVPPVKVAEQIAAIYDRQLKRLETNEAYYRAQMGDEARGLTTAGLAVLMTARDAEREMGRRVSRRTIYLSLQLARRLTERVKELASAWSFGYRELATLASLSGEAQESKAIELAEALVREQSGDAAQEDAPKKPPKGGRARHSRSYVMAQQRAIRIADGDTEKRLRRLPAEELQLMLDTDRAVIESVSRHLRLIESVLSGR